MCLFAEVYGSKNDIVHVHLFHALLSQCVAACYSHLCVKAKVYRFGKVLQRRETVTHSATADEGCMHSAVLAVQQLIIVGTC